MQLASWLRSLRKTQSERSHRSRRRANLSHPQPAITERLENRTLLSAVSTDFEGIASGDFSVGTERDTAQFAGDGFSGSSGIAELYRSGTSAWLVNASGTGTMAFDNPAINVAFHARLSSNATSGALTITTFDADDEVLDSAIITDAAADFREINFTGAISRIDVVNTTDQLISIDDFSADTAILVDIATDESDGDLSAGDVSLREGIELANSRAGHDTILFDTDAFSTRQTMVLDPTLGELSITDALSVEGPTYRAIARRLCSFRFEFCVNVVLVKWQNGFARFCAPERNHHDANERLL